MKGKKTNVEGVIRTLREIEVLRVQGASTDEVLLSLSVENLILTSDIVDRYA